MADIFTIEQRSRIMSRIKSRGTKPEERLYELVRTTLGSRRRILRNLDDLPGRPDLLVPSLKLILFADGCFYHSCPQHGHKPKSNIEYWHPKLERNIRSARSNRQRLRRMGYAVWSFWEHDLTPARLLNSQQRVRSLVQRLLATGR